MDADQAAQVLQRLRQVEQAATEQLNARTAAEHASIETQNRIGQLDQALQQGARPAVSVGQVTDTRVLGRPDKWDGKQHDEGLRGSHRPAAAGGHDKGRSQYGCVEQRQLVASQTVQKCAAVLPS